MKIANSWCVDYIRYRNPEFSGRYYAADKTDAERAAEKLRLMKHVSDVQIVSPGPLPKQQKGR
jgi:hypothetical protein